MEGASQQTSDHYDPGVNYDEQILAQQRQIEKEVVESQGLIGPQESILCLSSEYASDDTIYQQKIQHLNEKYKCLRKIRGDGNCFYRGFGFAYFESLLQDKEEHKRFKEVVTKSKDELIGLGFPQFTLEDFHETFMEAVEKVGSDCTLEDLLCTFNDQGYSDYLVVFLRLLVSGHLQKEHEFFQNFIEGHLTVKEFCNQEVEPMGKESDHIHITALTSSIGVPVRVEYMDRADSASPNTHSFPDGSSPSITLLYRPGHYDILYA